MTALGLRSDATRKSLASIRSDCALSIDRATSQVCEGSRGQSFASSGAISRYRCRVGPTSAEGRHLNCERALEPATDAPPRLRGARPKAEPGRTAR